MGLVKNIIRTIDPLTRVFLSYQKTIFPYYHLVSNEDLPHIKGLYSYKNVIDFEQDLDFLLKKYKILEPAEFIKCALVGKEIPSNSFLLSFDDGLSAVYDNVVPILNKKGVPAIFFINNGYADNLTLFYKHKISIIIQSLSVNENDKKIRELLQSPAISEDELIQKIKFIKYNQTEILDDLLVAIGFNEYDFLKSQKPYLTLSELKKMQKQGHYLGGHTTNHLPLDQLSFDEQVKEIIDSIVWLKENFLLNYELFSFPFSDAFASKKLIDKIFSEMPNLILMGNQGMKKDISNQVVQRFSLEKENQADIGVRTNIMYMKYQKLIGKGKVTRRS